MAILMPQNAKRDKQIIYTGKLPNLLNENPVHSMSLIIKNEKKSVFC